jgi:hypothetical protein
VGRRLARWVILGTVLVLAGFISVGVYVGLKVVSQSEDEQRDQAMELYHNGQLPAASERFGQLGRDFANSSHHDEYVFLADWAALAARMNDPQGDAASVAPALEAFLQKHHDDPQLKEHAGDVGKALATLAETFARQNAAPTGTEPRSVAGVLAGARDTLKKEAGPAAFAGDEERRVDESLGKVVAAVEHWQKRTDFVGWIKAQPGSAENLVKVRQALKDRAAEFPELDNDATVQSQLSRMEVQHLGGVRYEDAGEAGPAPPRPPEGPPSLHFDPVLQGTPGATPSDDPVKLALARGVLYALRQSNGSIKWARRVGVDTTALPVYVPATPAFRERYLVLSSVAGTLTALDADGNAVWEYHLDRPCLGRPLTVGNRVFVATYDGVIHVIDLARGALLGTLELHQHLTTGGAREEVGTGNDRGVKRLYFPADDSCVYVINVADKPACERILYTGHPSGSLRSEPVVIPPVRLPGLGEAPGYLVLNQADGLDAIRLRVYELPVEDPHQAPKPLEPDARLEGWTWFRPYRDEEKVAILSDRARLGLFGIAQANNKDQALFPLLSPGGLDVRPFLRGRDEKAAPEASRARAQVVYAQGEDFWVLAAGRLQRLNLAWSGREGPQAVAGWTEALPVGSPLHESQWAEDPRHGKATLFVVTQPLDRQTCVATAVDDEDGRVRWQRQLGLVCRGEPVALTPPGGGLPVLLALDQSGTLFALDPTRFPAGSRRPWQGGGEKLAGALADNPRMPPVLLAGPDAHTAYEVACPGDGHNVVVRQVDWEEPGPRKLRVKVQRDVPLGRSESLAGTPAVVGRWLVLPTAGGSLARLPLPLPENPDLRLSEGPDWRDRTSPRDNVGHVAALGEGMFLTTDGLKGVTCWSWGESSWNRLPPDGPTPGYDMPERIVAAPLVLPAGEGMLARACVADAGGHVHLLAVQKSGSLEFIGEWDVKGNLTDGPFLRHLPGGRLRIGCVVDDRRLVWLDPTRPGTLREYPARSPVVGRPEVIEGVVVVAEQEGRVVALDPVTLEPRGPGFQSGGSAIPVASPVPFGKGRVLAPLCDGTALLLGLDGLGQSSGK